MLARFRVPLGWGQLLKKTLWASLDDNVMGLAAQQAYYFFFALFPALLALISIASFFPIANLTDQIVPMLRGIVPGDVADIIETQMNELSKSNRGGLLTVAFLFTLWSTSTALVSMSTTLNAAYDVTESRPWWKVRLIAIGLTVGLAVFILVSAALVIAGPEAAKAIAQQVGLGTAFVWTWWILQWPVVFVLIATGIALVYYFAPDVEQEWVWLTPGSIFATLIWLAVSLGFRYYVTNFGNYNETYGVIGGVMVLLLWFWLSGIAILLGAELNAEIEHASPHGKDVGERVPGEKKAIGALAERAFEEKKAKGEIPAKPFPEGVNCDVDRRPAHEHAVRPSDLLIGTMALLPVALKVGRDVRKRIDDDRAA
ncbi:MAG TPA: YihY/virulence factor BrkB family protein [Vicinamibacterales bacterium]|nr:YihY/virulence factor BrkB family protein [Vicinamibacterales bacterium]